MMNKQLAIKFYVNKTSPVPYHIEYIGGKEDKGIAAEEHSEYIADWMMKHSNGKVEFVWED